MTNDLLKCITNCLRISSILRLCDRSHLNFLFYEENLIFFLSVYSVGKERVDRAQSTLFIQSKLSDHFMSQLACMNRANSITLDPHKSGFCPYPAGGLLYRWDTGKLLICRWTADLQVNCWSEGELLIWRWTADLQVNCWSAGEPLICRWTADLQVNCWSACELLICMWTADLQVNCWSAGKHLVYRLNRWWWGWPTGKSFFWLLTIIDYCQKARFSDVLASNFREDAQRDFCDITSLSKKISLLTLFRLFHEFNNVFRR